MQKYYFMHISAVIITHNEERNILRCLNSVQDVVDEIVVVDSFSTDQTEEICKKFEVKFVKQQWQGYSEQKNFANSLAANDWILSIDADEALTDELKHSILKYKNKHVHQSVVFSMNRLTNYCGHWIRHCGWYPDRKIRLWNRKVGKWQGEIHETLEFSTEVKEKQLKGDLLHYSFENAYEYEEQQFKFAKMRGEHYFKKGKKHANFYMKVSPIFSFIQNYIFKLGLLDGADGFHICRTTAKATRLKYQTLKELTDKNL